MNAALIVAGGIGERFGGDIPKQYHRLQCSQHVISKTIQVFLNHSEISMVWVVINRKHQKYYDLISHEIHFQPKLMPVIYGGKTRQDSVYIGLKTIQQLSKIPEKILIHDAVRPFMSNELIINVVDALDKYEAVDVGVPVVDTLKTYDGKVIPREGVYATQTPQGFSYNIIMDLHEKMRGQEFTDDISLYIAAGGKKLGIVEGESSNIKITYPQDLMKNAI